MACVTTKALYNINSLIKKSRNVDYLVERWSKDEVDTCLNRIADQVTVVPSKKALKKKLQRTDRTTFHDGQPVTLVEDGNLSLLLKTDMFDENMRYLTFFRFDWPNGTPVSPSVLAKAGFFYFGESDTVQCFSCSGRINNWAPGDTAMGEHRKFYPRCDFVKGIENRNVPAKGLVYESLKGPGEKKGKKSGASSSPEDEAGCFENSLSNLVESLKINDAEAQPPPSLTTNYFKKELNRLLTFKLWSMSSPVDKFDLAAAGFYCVNESTGVVQCFACFGRLSEWKLGDRPKVEHRRKFSSCPFVLGRDTGNEPLTKSDKEIATKFFAEGPGLRQPQQITTNLPQSARFTPVGQSLSTSGRSVHPLTLATAQDPNDLTVKYAKYSQHAYEQARLETYSHWPRNHSQIPANLARAGFFATGNEDEVKCFYCGGGLKDWALEDDPWEEHARWFSRCEWLLQQRGPGFVDAVRRKYGTSEPYFEPNTAPSSRSDLSPVAKVAPHHFTVSSASAEPEPKSNVPRQSEPKKRESKKQPPKKKQEKKKQAKKSKSLDERVEELFQTDMVKFMVDMGYEEAIVKSVLRKWLQSGQDSFPNSEALLTAIFAEEELQKSGASNAGPEGPALPNPKKPLENGSLSGSTESLNSQENASTPENKRKSHEGHRNDNTQQLFGQFKLRLGDHLTVADCLRLSTLLALPRSSYDMLEEDHNPALRLLEMLESRGVITERDVTDLESALLKLNLRRAAREVAEYQSVATRIGSKPESTTTEESGYDDFEPNPAFEDTLSQLSEYLSLSDVEQLSTLFALSPRDKDNVKADKEQAKAFLMLLYRKDRIGPDDTLFLSEALKELNLSQAARVLDDLMRIKFSEDYEQPSGDMQSEEIEKLKEKSLCKICLDQNVEILFLPCKHLVTCADCASRINLCPICRCEIEDKLHVFMP